MENINLWGLASYKTLKYMYENKYSTSLDYRKENVTGWYNPTTKIINEILKPAYQEFLNDTSCHGHDLHNHSYEQYIYKTIGDNKLEV